MHLPYASKSPGIYQVCTTANEDYAIAVPDGATGCVLWFETSASNDTIIGGRVAVDDVSTKIASVTATDAKMGYAPAMPIEYAVAKRANVSTGTLAYDPLYLHVANATALAVAKGFWTFGPAAL